MGGLKSCQLHCAGGQSSVKEQSCSQRAWLSFAWLCGHVVGSGKCGSTEWCLEEKEGKRRGLVGPVLGAVEKDVDQHRCDFCSLRVYVGRVYSLFAFHFLKETVC